MKPHGGNAYMPRSMLALKLLLDSERAKFSVYWIESQRI